MNCQSDSNNPNSDRLELHAGNSLIGSANAWLIYQAIMHLNSSEKEAEVSYKYTIELLVKSGATKTIAQLMRAAPKTDTTLQWSLLYVLGDLQDPEAAGWLGKYALEQLPARGESCEGPRDSELLLRTMAVESIKKIATKNPESAEYLLRIIASQPEREVLVEAVKAAVELGLKEKVIEILPKEYHWILDIKKAKTQELFADPERADSKEIGYVPPKKMADYNSPSIKCACTKGGNHHG